MIKWKEQKFGGYIASIAPGLVLSVFYDAIGPRENDDLQYAVWVFGKKQAEALSMEEGKQAAAAAARKIIAQAAEALSEDTTV